MKRTDKINGKNVQDSLLDLENLTTTLKENANSAVKELLDESVRDTYNRILMEDADDEEDEDEVEDTNDAGSKFPKKGAKSSKKDAGSADDDDEDDGFEADFEDEDGGKGHMSFKSGNDGKGGKWAQFSKYKVSDGEYDFTDADDDEIVDAYNMLGDDDSIVVKREDDGNIAVTDNETGTEYIIDLDDMDAEKHNIGGENGDDDEFSDDSLDSYVDDELSGGEDDDDDAEFEAETDDDEPDDEPDLDDDDEAEFDVDLDDDDDLEEGIGDFAKGMMHHAKNGLKKMDKMFRDSLDDIDDIPNPTYIGDDDEDDDELTDLVGRNMDTFFDDIERNKKHKKNDMKESRIFEIYLNEDHQDFTDNYQRDDVMTTPGMEEPGKNVNDWDKGVPHGKSKPWSGYKGQKSADQPFDNRKDESNYRYGNVFEEGDFPEDVEFDAPYDEDDDFGGALGNAMGFDGDVEECGNFEECGSGLYDEEEGFDGDDFNSSDVEEGGHTFGKVQAHSTAKTYKRNNPGGDAYVNNTGSASKSGEYLGRGPKTESVIRKANQIMAENEQLKKALIKFKGTLKEAALTNVNLGQIIKLLSENATTFDEKKEIISRFGNEARTIRESQRLYETISRELKKNGGLTLNEGKQYGVLGSRKLNETQIYQDKDMLKSLDMMHKICPV